MENSIAGESSASPLWRLLASMRFFLRHVALLVRHFQNFGCEIGYSVFIYYLLVYIFACFWPATGMSRSPSSRVRSGSPMRRNQAYEGKKYAGYHLDFNFPSLIVPKHGVTQKDDVKAGEMGNLIGVKTALDFAAKTSKSICTIPEAKNLQHKTPFSPKDYGDESNIDLTTKTIQGG